MERREEIEQEAYRRYPSEMLGTKGMIDSTRRKMFIEGAEWADSMPSDETVNKVIKLRDSWIRHMMDNGEYISAGDWIRKNW